MPDPAERPGAVSDNNNDGQWRQAIDSQSGRPYYWNIVTRETTWKRPLNWPPSQEAPVSVRQPVAQHHAQAVTSGDPQKKTKRPRASASLSSSSSSATAATGLSTSDCNPVELPKKTKRPRASALLSSSSSSATAATGLSTSDGSPVERAKKTKRPRASALHSSSSSSAAIDAASNARGAKRGKSEDQRKHDMKHDYSVVQCTLNSFKNPELEDATWTSLYNELNTVAEVMSQLNFEAYLLAEFHMRRLLNEGITVPKISQSFFRSCLSLLSSSSNKIKDVLLAESFVEYVKLRPESLTAPLTENLSHVLDSTAREMMTATKNHVALNLVTRLARYIQLRYNGVDNPAMARKFMWIVFDPTYGPGQAHLVDDQRDFRDWIELNPWDSKVVEDNLGHFLRKMLDILNFYETLPPNTKGAKGFTLLPKKNSFTPGFYFIDPTSLPGLLKRLEKEKQVAILDAMDRTLGERCPPTIPADELLRLRTVLVQRREAQTKFQCHDPQDKPLTQLLWRTIFNVATYETRTRTFALKASTDGYTVSIYLQKPKPRCLPASDEYHSLIRAQTKYANGDYDLIMGFDPGRTYPVFGFRGEEEPGADNTPQSFCPRVSTKEYHHDSKYTANEQSEVRMRHQYPAYKEAIQALPSLKVGTFAVFKANVRLTLVQAPFLLDFQSNKRKFRARRFKFKRFSKKASAKAARKMTRRRGEPHQRRDCYSPSRTIIGWGDWSQQDGFLRGTPKAPVKKFRREFNKLGFTIVEVDEYRTSKCCSSCGHETENVRYDGVRCHQVVRCGNSECGMVWQRDCNASRNIRSVLITMLQGELRPLALRRA